MTGSRVNRPTREPAADLARNYRVAFLRYLPGRGEVALAAAYDLGRQAMIDGISVLQIVRIHHEVLRAVIGETTHADIDGVLSAAADFLSETLAAADMVQRDLIRLDDGS